MVALQLGIFLLVQVPARVETTLDATLTPVHCFCCGSRSVFGFVKAWREAERWFCSACITTRDAILHLLDMLVMSWRNTWFCACRKPKGFPLGGRAALVNAARWVEQIPCCALPSPASSMLLCSWYPRPDFPCGCSQRGPALLTSPCQAARANSATDQGGSGLLISGKVSMGHIKCMPGVQM